MDSSLEMVIVPPTKDLGGFAVRRALPSAHRQMVGPFIFFDEIGPAILRTGQGIDVRPHPHIGLATVTYLFDGELLHRDNLGSVQSIQPGAVNWMTAGRGIVHSERTPPELRPVDSKIFGIQSWVALPKAHEEREPSFVHHPAASLPVVEGEGKRACVIAGKVFGASSPVETLSETFYADVACEAGARVEMPGDHEERAAFVVEGTVSLEDGSSHGEGRLLVFRPGEMVTLLTPDKARVMLLGGAAMDGPRHIWWNFVSSSSDRIRDAAEGWKDGRFAQIPGETEFIPLPGTEHTTVRYP